MGSKETPTHSVSSPLLLSAALCCEKINDLELRGMRSPRIHNNAKMVMKKSEKSGVHKTQDTRAEMEVF